MVVIGIDNMQYSDSDRIHNVKVTVRISLAYKLITWVLNGKISYRRITIWNVLPEFLKLDTKNLRQN